MPVQTSLSSSITGPRVLALLATAALLSACSSQPRYTAQQESTQYRSHAGRSYTPPGPASDPWGPYIKEAAAKFDVPERWVREVMRQESGGRLYGRGGDLVTSGAGAMGLMQVMPATYDEIHGRYPELGSDPYDPHNNIMAGTAYIREMYDIYGSPGFLAAYNAGPGRLDDYLTRNRSLPEETRRYVAAIGPRIAGTEPRTPSPGQQYAMNAVPFGIPEGPRYASASRYSAPSSFEPSTTAPSAYAANGSYIRLNPPAPIQPDAPAPIQLAAVPAGPRIVLSPQPVEVAQASEAPRGPFIVLRPQPVEVAQIPEPSRPEPPRLEPARLEPARLEPARLEPAHLEPARPVYTPAPVPSRMAEVVQMPEPPAYVPPPSYREPPRTQQQLAVAALVPVSPRGGGFNFISSAHAEAIGGPRGTATAGNWAVQVGAFANEGLAAWATSSARDHAREVLGAARSNVSSVRQAHGVLYRARLTGLSRDAASQACERLSRARTTCIVVSPDAQS